MHPPYSRGSLVHHLKDRLLSLLRVRHIQEVNSALQEAKLSLF